jgi:FAD/FMN-containing dehydrogenase
MGGSISAEHGIGVLKRDELPDVKDKVAIELMRGIKAMLDPLGIMNPGKVSSRRSEPIRKGQLP